MITRNMRELMKLTSCISGEGGSSSAGTVNLAEQNVNLTLTSGNKVVCISKQYLRHPFDGSLELSLNPTQTSGMSANRLSFGTGTTLPTDEDYNLENVITSGITSVTVTNTNAIDIDENGKVTKTVNIGCLFKNTSGSELTISEVGLYQFVYSSSSTKPSFSHLLLYREVLEEPMVLQADEYGDYKLEVSIVHNFE